MMEMINEIRRSLLEFADEKRVAFARKSYPTSMEVIGVTVPNLKVVLKELKDQTTTFPDEQKLDLIKSLVDQNVFELQQLAFEYLESSRGVLKNLTERDIDDLEKNLDNWVLVDYFGLVVVGYAWRENIVGTEKIKKYLESDDYWKRRVAVVATVALNLRSRGGKGDTGRTLEVCKLVVGDHQEMIIKALSWALRELGKHDRLSVISFVEKYEDQLHKKVLREFRNKLETGTKN